MLAETRAGPVCLRIHQLDAQAFPASTFIRPCPSPGTPPAKEHAPDSLHAAEP